MLLSNMNTETHIHFGVIQKNDLYNCAEEFYMHAIDISYEEALKELLENVKSLIEDVLHKETVQEILETIENEFGETYQNDYALMRYKQDGYIIRASNDDPDLFVIKSPFFTMAPGCSPCAPGAGYLRDAVKVGKTGQRLKKDWMSRGPYMTYCLPEDWFEDGKCPYTYWKCSEET